jgi:hypothetical protein
MEQENFISTKAIHPALIGMLIWIFTSVILGIGWFFYSMLFEEYRESWICILVAVCAAMLSLPVFIALCIAIPHIKNSDRQPVGKIKRLVLTCFLCTLPYAFIIACFSAGNSENNSYPVNYLLHALAISGILFSCSVIAMLITGRPIKQLFYARDENEFLINQIGQEINN